MVDIYSRSHRSCPPCHSSARDCRPTSGRCSTRSSDTWTPGGCYMSERPSVKKMFWILKLSFRGLLYLYLCPGCLEAFGPNRLVRQVEGELEHIGLGEDLLVGVQAVTAQLYGCLLLGPPGPDPQGRGGAASLWWCSIFTLISLHNWPLSFVRSKGTRIWVRPLLKNQKFRLLSIKFKNILFFVHNQDLGQEPMMLISSHIFISIDRYCPTEMQDVKCNGTQQ